MGETTASTLYDNLPDNSHKNRSEKKEITEGKRAEKVIHGKAKIKKNGCASSLIFSSAKILQM